MLEQTHLASFSTPETGIAGYNISALFLTGL
jgi:hypothetical protein